VVARGEISLGHLNALGIASARFRQDTSFALVVSDNVRDRAREAIARACTGDGPLVIYSPSAVVKRHCEKIGLDMVAIAAEALGNLSAQGVRIALLPHSTDTGIRKNNDYSVAREIVDVMSRRGISISLLDARGDPRLARAMIACADVFIASRFHSMIAALSQAVPVVTIGWSHKYAEAAEPFGMDRFTIDYSQMDAARLDNLVQDLLREREALVPGLRQASDEARRSAIEGIRLVVERKPSR
jgi:polysaccharide pyruvyl transferase WcaK-like protein